MDTVFNQYPITTNTQEDISNLTNKRQIYLKILAEMIKEFNGMTIQSTINESLYYDSQKDDAKSDPKINSLVGTHISDRNKRKITDNDTTNRNFPYKLLTDREIPAIIQGVTPPVNQTTADGVTTSRGSLHAERAVLQKEIFTGARRSNAGVLKDPLVKTWKDASGKIPVDKNTVLIRPVTNTQVLTGNGPSVPPVIGSDRKRENLVRLVM